MKVIATLGQGTQEWFAARSGKITGSNIHLIMKKGRGSEWSKQAISYAEKLAAERICGIPEEYIYGTFSNAYTEYGKQMEEVTRAKYEALKFETIKQVDFVVSGIRETIGCSPDGLTNDALIEIKNFAPKHFLKIALEGLDEEVKLQALYNAWVCEKPKAVVLIHNEYMTPDMLIFEFDTSEFTQEMRDRVLKFDDYVNELVEKFRANTKEL